MNTTKDPFLSDNTYNNLHRLALRILPALGGLYFGLSVIWGFPYGEQVVGSLALVNVFIGIVVGINQDRYNPYSGDLVVENFDGSDGLNFWLDLNEIPEDFVDRDEILMRIRNNS
jgi:hypothetical protein